MLIEHCTFQRLNASKLMFMTITMSDKLVDIKRYKYNYIPACMLLILSQKQIRLESSYGTL